MAPEFTVIKGGKDAKRTSKYRKMRDIRSVADSITAKPPGLLIEAAATNTRLMGVTGVELVWETYSGSIFRQTADCFDSSEAVSVYVHEVSRLVYERYTYAYKTMENNYFRLVVEE